MRQMKKLIPLLAALCLLLAACGGGGDAAKPFDPETAAAAVLDSGCFSVALEELDAALLYDFQGYGVEDGAVTSSKAYSASGFTEQVAVLACKDEDAAGQVKAFLEQYLADMKDSYKDYAPAEVPKLDAAILEQRGASVLLVVPADAAKAQSAVDGLGK